MFKKNNRIILSEREIFVEFLKNNNLTNTAKKLNLYPSTVSRAITALENHLNIKLIKKVDGKLTLTEQGVSYGTFLQKKIETLRSFEHKLSNDTLELDIIATEWFLTNIVTPAISESVQQNIKVKINLIANTNLNSMRHDKPTIFIGTERQNKKSENMSLKNISEVSLGIYAHKECPSIDFSNTYTPKDVQNMNIINVIDGDGQSVIRFSGEELLSFPNSLVSTDNLQSSFEEGMTRKCPFIACPTVTRNALSQNQCIKIKTLPSLDKIYIDVIFSKIENHDFLVLARAIHQYGKKIFHPETIHQ
ncbi:hypothetical protein ATPR_3209 [Acetobacter tropicalis NBRC 101654]|uniref:HTH lysR-type domain-containing protein n=1 Tax=Acetobacter tropicalis NBRC 101654 TaxID=749388 RepID=F7VIL0_9PROT|nr:LysR family transcriptional regulator [Acetobacter tropicalis]GAA10205.1 hypothetical protein ATPR_3209 [Acetobacter tropicalis NBRC 101654]